MTDPTIEEVREALTALLVESDERRRSTGPSPESLLMADGRSQAYRDAIKLLEPKPFPVEEVIASVFVSLACGDERPLIRLEYGDGHSTVTNKVGMTKHILSALAKEGYRIVHESEQS